ncbi:MAG: kynureninase [Erysipelotrichales bacterium]
MKELKLGVDFAKELDAENPLAMFRDRFYKKSGEIYMDGNSLGMANKDAKEALLDVMDVWVDEEIKIWNTREGFFFNISREIAKREAPLLNCDPEEIAIMGTITSNIHQIFATFYRPTKERYKVIIDDLNFASDIYAVTGMVEVCGGDPKEAIVSIPSADGRTLNEDDIIAAMDEDVAIIWLPSVLYRSAQLLDMERITKEAHKRGILVGWSLAHSMGAVPHDFRKIDPDFASWCNYKYINGGPGANGGLFINKKHFGTHAGMRGWFGNKDQSQFALNHEFEQDNDANGWLIGTHNMFSMVPVYGALKIYEEAGIHNIRKVSLDMTRYLMFLVDERLSQYGYSVGNPREDEIRGGHVSVEHKEAYRIAAAMRDMNVIPDFREPNVVRVAPIALYNTYEEIYQMVDVLEKIVVDKIYENYSNERDIVV